MLTKQEIFDKVFMHLMTQNDKSYSDVTREMCAYRGTDGKQCAVGCLIKDEFYSKAFEGVEVCADEVLDALLLSEVDTEDDEIVDMLQALQTVHDSKDVDKWAKELCCLAVIYGVQIPDAGYKYIV